MLFNKFYNSGIFFYELAVRLASVRNHKAKKWISGRKNWEEDLGKAKRNLGDKIIWVHCASLGEFEQGRPVIDQLKLKCPGYKILLTFFSPSGYEIRKNYPGVNHVCYLPVDSEYNAGRFIEIINPALAIFIKYEFWFNYINELYKRRIPLFIVSAIFRSDQYFFKSYASWFRKQLKKVTFFGVQNLESFNLLRNSGVDQVEITGDTRFDRVFALSENISKNDFVAKFKGKDLLLVAGSTWPRDEEVLFDLLKNQPGLKFIIAPHETNKSNIDNLLELFGGSATTYSALEAKNGVGVNVNVIIIDSVGLLSKLYAHADIAYIGGGFGVGIHNILEPATYGKPVIIGPNYKKFKEAIDLIAGGSVFSIGGKADLKSTVSNLITNDKLMLTAGVQNRMYVEANTGATEKIIEKITGQLKIKNATA